jgi:hypothetical protein
VVFFYLSELQYLKFSSTVFLLIGISMCILLWIVLAMYFSYILYIYIGVCIGSCSVCFSALV